MSKCLLLSSIPIDTVKTSIVHLALVSLNITPLDQCIFVLLLNRKLGLMT